MGSGNSRSATEPKPGKQARRRRSAAVAGRCSRSISCSVRMAARMSEAFALAPLAMEARSGIVVSVYGAPCPAGRRWFRLATDRVRRSGKATVGGGSERDLVIAGGVHAGGEAARIGVRTHARPGQKLHPRGDDLMRAARVALLVLPGAVLQPAFDQGWGAFLQILAADLGLGAKDHDVDEAGILAPLAIVAFDACIDRQPQGGDRGAIGAVAHLGGAGEVAEEHDQIDGGHDRTPLSRGERGRVLDALTPAGADRPRPLANGLWVGVRRGPWGACAQRV